MNALDVLGIALSSGLSAPAYAQPFRGGFAIAGHFGDPVAGGIRAGLQLTGTATVRTPHNVSLTLVPSLSGQGADAVAAREALTEKVRALRHPEGSVLTLADLQAGDVLLELWPGAFRALEAVFASLEVPTPESAGGALPGFPVPRTWLLRGISTASLQAAVQAEVNRQFSGGNAPALSTFSNRASPVYVPVDSAIGTAGGSLDVRCFDTMGLPVCPNAVLGTFKLLANDVGALFAKPDAATASAWAGPTRLVFVFSDDDGAPYTPWLDPEGPAPPVPPLPEDSRRPRRALRFAPLPAETVIPENGVVVVPQGDAAYNTLVNGLTDVVFDGAALGGQPRVLGGTSPHGVLSDSPTLSIQHHSFLRIRLLDLARWFPHHPNPKTDFQRYSLGNALVPLADGRPAFREIHRAIRATHRIESHTHLDHLPEGQPRGPQPDPAFQALLINAWFSPNTPLRGRRAMTRAARTQPGALQGEDDPALDGLVPWAANDLLSRFTLLPIAHFPEDAADEVRGGPDWAWLTPPGALPDGAWLQLQLIDTLDQHRAPDPADPAAIATVDAFGNLSVTGTPSGFVGLGGQCCLSVTYDPAHDVVGTGGNPALRGELLVVTWTPDDGDPAPDATDTAGKGTPAPRAFGVVQLEAPVADPAVPAAFSQASVTLVPGAHLERTAAAGSVDVVLPDGMITGACVVVVVNPRTGDVFWRSFAAAATSVRLSVEGFAYKDRLLVGFRAPPAQTGEAFPANTDAAAVPPDITACSHLFELSFSDEAYLSGQVPAHSRESLGMVREAIDAGVDVRLLAWRDDTKAIKDQLSRSLGGVLGVNAEWDGKRGQGILDGITRETASHHQKPAFVYGPDGPIGFVGGIDQAGGRYAPRGHHSVDPDRPGDLWHDIHCKVHGPAALDVYRNFRDRWNAWLAHPELPQPGADPDDSILPADPGLTPLPDMPQAYKDAAPSDGPHVVQINRTIPRSVEQYTAFLDPGLGDQSIKASYERAFSEARRFLYFEEQYWWHVEYARRINERLHNGELDFVMLLLPRFLAEMKYIDLLLYAVRREALSMLLYGTTTLPAPGQEAAAPRNVADKVALFHIRNDAHQPVYVHCKCIIADDTWMTIGSSNMNRRSFTYDTELAAATVDTRVRRGGHRTIRAFRVDLLAEHLKLSPAETPLIEDPYDAFRLIKDVLEGRSSRKTHLLPVNLRETHYGIQPTDMDGDFHEALRIAFDPDGEQLSLPGRMLTLAALLHGAMDSDDAPNFSGFGTLRLIPALSGGGDVAQLAGLQARFTVTENVADAQPIHMGPFPADRPALLGLVETGARQWTLSATVSDPASPDTPLWTASIGAFSTPQPSNQQTVSYSPVP